MQTKRMMALMLSVGLMAAPALAQNPQPGSTSDDTTTRNTQPGAATPTLGTPAGNAAHPSTGAPGTAGSAGGAMDSTASASSRNPVLAEGGDVRASRVIGSSVYNDKNEKLGSIDDIMVGKDMKATHAVISIGGLLGVGAKLVAVPYDKLQFPENIDSNTARVVMPNTSADALNGMPTFNYASK